MATVWVVVAVVVVVGWWVWRRRTSSPPAISRGLAMPSPTAGAPPPAPSAVAEVAVRRPVLPSGEDVKDRESKRDVTTQQDENERTNEVGLYHYALSYWKAASFLAPADLGTTHPDAPVSFLHYQAMELFLKSFLRLHGHTVGQLRTIGHRIDKLAKLSVERGLHLEDEDHAVISLATTDVVLRARYIRTGPFSIPTSEARDRTCKSLRQSVGDALIVAGKPIRPFLRD